ncbi:hypothetical protein [Candidatus Nitronereus thalassa]|uniref:Uncharacterized protein n=1 Tax=Candidatus Nitronereus thalassa TaxID=3020898 RepID=A0ABU3KAV9_9BACT|nr:hypothetical protein [Candidatus Nitronereus thalassa]MDT7043619.1 hypothetical protein [Candidatus Nitronereus thalassa]
MSMIVLFVLTIPPVALATTKITGTVSAVGKGEAVVEIGKGASKTVIPSIGDQVQFMLKIADLDIRTKSGTGSVVRVDGKRITVRVTDGKPAVGHEATIQATGKPSSSAHTTSPSSQASSAESSLSSDSGLTPSRITKLNTLLNSEDVMYELRNAICLKEQWCLAGHNTEHPDNCGYLGSTIRVCGKRAAAKSGFTLSFGKMSQDAAMDQRCENLWSSLTPEDWKILETGTPCRELLPDALRVAALTEEEASCVAKFECEGKSEKKQKRCEEKYRKCTQNQIGLSPMERESCRKKREKMDDEESVQQCLRPTTPRKQAAVEPEVEKPKSHALSACQHATGFWIPEKKNEQVDYMELALDESQKASHAHSAKGMIRVVGANATTGSWECLDPSEGQVALDVGDTEPYVATITTDPETDQVRLCVDDGELICLLRTTTRPETK